MRWLPFEQCGNFRDIGGYPAADGHVTRWRRVYRSGALTAMSPADVDCLTGELGVRCVLDLRTDAEIERVGTTAWLDRAGVTTIRLPQDNPALAALAPGAYDAAALYQWNLERKAADFAALLEVIARGDRLPCVVQCSGGKDRTGILIALLLELLGVGDHDIVEDYALSDESEHRFPDEYKAARASVIAAGLDPETLHARAATMRTFLPQFRSSWGSAEEFATHGGADETMFAQVREQLLDPSD